MKDQFNIEEISFIKLAVQTLTEQLKDSVGVYAKDSEYTKVNLERVNKLTLITEKLNKL